ncbi:hypothetical protein KEM55_002723 [Ascosphaera atra]|nr:hypothetical protein KEM55_002723 [Ascosphaera atra]
MARREEEWNLEREAVARQIQEANESQVIMLDSERESAGGMEEMQVDEEHNVLEHGEDEQPEGLDDVNDEAEATDPATGAVNDVEQVEEVVDDDLDIWQEEARQDPRLERQHQGQGHREAYYESDEGISQDAVPTFMDWRRKSSRPEGFEYMSPPKTKTQVERLREGDVSKLLGSPSSVVEKFYRDNGASPVKDLGHEYDNMPEHDAAESWGQHQEGDFLEEASLAYAKADEYAGEENVDEANEFANPKDVSPAAEVAVGGQLVATPAWLKPRRLPYLDSPALANPIQPAQQQPRREIEHMHASAKVDLPLVEEEHTTLPDEASKQTRQEAPDARKKRRHGTSRSKEAPHHRRRARPEAAAKDLESEMPHVSASQGKRDAPTVQQTTPFAVRAKRIPIASLSPQKSRAQPKTSKLKPRSSHREPKVKGANTEERRDAKLARNQASSGTEKPPRSSWLTRLASLAPSWLRGSQDFTDVSEHAAHATETAASSQERLEQNDDKQGSLGDSGVVLSDHAEVAPRQKPSASEKTSHKPQHPSKRQSATGGPRKSLATSGYFTDDHYYFLRSLYRHARATPESFPYIASPTKDALVGQTMAAANGAYSRQVTKLEIAVVDKFKECLSEQSIRRGGNGTVGWTDLELLSQLFTIIVGAEIRKERKKKHLGRRKHAPATGDVVSR